MSSSSTPFSKKHSFDHFLTLVVEDDAPTERSRLIPFSPTLTSSTTSSSSSSSSSRRLRIGIREFCDDIWIHILSFVSPYDLVRISRTNKRFRQLSCFVGLWENQFGGARAARRGSINSPTSPTSHGRSHSGFGVFGSFDDGDGGGSGGSDERDGSVNVNGSSTSGVVVYDEEIMKRWVEEFGKVRKGRFLVYESLWSLGLNSGVGDGVDGGDGPVGDGQGGGRGGGNSLLRILLLGEEGDGDSMSRKGKFGDRLVRRAERKCCSIRSCLMGWGNPLRCGMYCGLFGLVALLLCMAWPVVLVFYVMTDTTFPWFRSMNLSRFLVGIVAIALLTLVIFLCFAIVLFRIADDAWFACVVGKRFHRCDRAVANVRPRSEGRLELERLRDTLYRKWKGTSAHWMMRYTPTLVPTITLCLTIPTFLLASLLKTFSGVAASLGVGCGVPFLALLLFSVYHCLISSVTKRDKFIMENKGDDMICCRLMSMSFLLHIVPVWLVGIIQLVLTVVLEYDKSVTFGIPVWVFGAVFAVWLVVGYCWVVCAVNNCCCCSDEAVSCCIDLPCWDQDEELYSYCGGGGLLCCCSIPFIVAASMAAAGLQAWAVMIPIGIGISCGCCCLTLALCFISADASLWKQNSTRVITNRFG